MDGIHGVDSRMQTSDEQHPIHMPYEHHGLHHMSNGNEMDDDQNNGGGGDSNCESAEGEIHSNNGNLHDNHTLIMDQGNDIGDQLTLSFQGQVYVFDSVSPEKVHQLIFACSVSIKHF
jgi:hypothetical protein